MLLLSLKNISKSYSKTTVLSNISFDVFKKDIIAILGPSGSGKSTILKIISGVIQPNEGKIIYKDLNLSRTPVYKRNFGVVFQGYSLFPHMTVFDNIAFPLTTSNHKVSKQDIKTRVDKIITLLGLGGLEKRKPKEISGGQQQRVAIARAIIFNPDILLLDEPLAALDTKLKKQFLEEIKRINTEFGITIIYITHDQSEAMYIANKIIVIDNGKLMQKATPYDLYNKPKNEFVLDFFGESNILLLKNDFDKLSNNLTDYLDCKNNSENSNSVRAFIRPENILISIEEPETDYYFISGKLSSETYMGDKWRNDFIINDSIKWTIYNESKSDFQIGKLYFLYWDKNDLITFKNNYHANN